MTLLPSLIGMKEVYAVENTSTSPILSHLEEMRTRLIIVGISFLLCFALSFAVVGDIYSFLIRDLEDELAILGPGDIIWIYMALSAVIAIIPMIPLGAYQVWSFVAPGLTREEKRSTLSYIPLFFFLFIAGLSFGFFIIFPLIMDFLLGLADSRFQTLFTVDRYFRFMFRTVIPIAFLFELPAVVMFATQLGLIHSRQLQRYRKYAYFVLIAMAVLVTPPDFITPLLVCIPLFLLYEASVFFAKLIERKK